MPYADNSRNIAARMDWARRNPEKVKAIRDKHRSKRKFIHKITKNATKINLEPKKKKWNELTIEEKRYYKKLRRNGLSTKLTRLEIYGEEFGKSCAWKTCFRFIPCVDDFCKQHIWCKNNLPREIARGTCEILPQSY